MLRSQGGAKKREHVLEQNSEHFEKERARFEGLRRQVGAGGIPFPTLASKTSFCDVACKKQYKAATTSRFGMITIFLLRNATDLYITAHVGLQGNK